ncbi:hypothetical protein MTR67_048653 [Solanum verrucosum]|uniref:DUF4218 domain-containing protein n=1 Tax=Solanum verrucosum TaxID=315347 RepID=A0AAF0UYD7_SOLVR|nr:hypothetical protein MTR67_048653 [Solanum verrucosum]
MRVEINARSVILPDFASETRNVRLALATDGFNPFGNLSSSPKMLGNSIDVYLQPLIAELKQLWGGVNAYDSSTKEMFQLRIALMWTISDFPDNYASNISRCIDVKKHKISNLKSHDSHMDVKHVENLQQRIWLNHANMGAIFPPSFFTIMFHLVIHIGEEARLVGHVQGHWMYPVERRMGHFKSYVHNNSVAEDLPLVRVDQDEQEQGDSINDDGDSDEEDDDGDSD